MRFIDQLIFYGTWNDDQLLVLQLAVSTFTLQLAFLILLKLGLLSFKQVEQVKVKIL